VAIIGAGAAGLAAAWCLGRQAGQFEVVVFEKSARVGGNALAVEVPLDDGRVGHVDIGVLFFNRHCPHWRAMIDAYRIRHEAMQGTLAVEIGDLRWAHGALDGMGRENLRESGRFERWLARCDAVNRLFERIRLASLNPLNVVSIDALLRLLRFSRDFRVQVLRPNLEFLAVNSASIYGMPIALLAYIAERLEAFRILAPIDVLFFPGSTREYYAHLVPDLSARLLLERAATGVRRTERGVTVRDARDERHEFDEVIFACNANHALEILEDATAPEREFLSATRYQTSEIVVHRDVSRLPRDESRWRHYNLRHTGAGEDYEITALSPRLQVRSSAPILVTYRPHAKIDPGAVVAVHRLQHVIHDVAHHRRIGTKAHRIQGVRHTWFVGGHMLLNFHEAAIVSGIAVACALGAEYPFASNEDAIGLYERLGGVLLGERLRRVR
jgi:predicted NAD/FAD-binding protein